MEARSAPAKHNNERLKKSIFISIFSSLSTSFNISTDDLKYYWTIVKGMFLENNMSIDQNQGSGGINVK